MAGKNVTTGRVDDTRSDVIHVGAVDYEKVADDYLERRQLRKGAAGWILLAGLGVSYVISGDFAGWNFGLEQGGFGGLLIATLLMAAMYTCMVFGIAELSASIPTAGGGYGFARRAMGRGPLRQRRPPGRPGRRDGVPGLRPVSAYDRSPEPLVRPRDPQGIEA